MTVQFCVRDDLGAQKLKYELAAIAKAEHMDFVDGSASTKAGMNIKIDPVIYASIEQNHKVIFMAGNLYLPRYQILASVFPNNDSDAAKAFAGRAKARLAEHWQLRVLQPGSSASHMADCPPNQIVK